MLNRRISDFGLRAMLFACLGAACLSASCSRPLPDTDFRNLAVLFNIALLPAVTGTAPADGATDVALSERPAVLFNRPMDASTFTAQTADGTCSGSFQVSSDNFENCIGGTVSSTTNQTTFVLVVPGGLSAETTYRIKATTDAKDTEGTALTSEFAHATGFTTQTTPTVTSITPANGTTNVNLDSTVQFTFNRDIVPETVFAPGSIGVCPGATIQLSPFPAYTICYPGTLATSDNRTFTLTPSAPLPEGVPLYFRVASSVLDTKQTNMTANFDTTFTPYSPLNTGAGTLQLWLKAGNGTFTDAGVTAANNGDKVQQWNDQSGNNNHATQTTAVNQPILVTGILNGQAVMRFDGVTAPNNDFFDLATIAADPEAFSFTIFFVHQGSGVGSQALLSQQNGGGLGRVLLEHKPADRHGSNLAGSGLGGTAGYTDNTWIIYSMVWDRVNATAGTITLYQNGNVDGDSGIVDPDAANGAWRIGVNKNGTGTPFDGRIAEILIYNSALGATDRQRVECYLSRKYGLTVTGHTCG